MLPIEKSVIAFHLTYSDLHKSLYLEHFLFTGFSLRNRVFAQIWWLHILEGNLVLQGREYKSENKTAGMKSKGQSWGQGMVVLECEI